MEQETQIPISDRAADMTEQIENSVADCDEHFRGMLQVHRQVLSLAKSDPTFDQLESLKNELEKKQASLKPATPYEVGLQDGYKREINSLGQVIEGSLSIDELIDALEYEINNLRRIVS